MNRMSLVSLTSVMLWCMLLVALGQVQGQSALRSDFAIRVDLQVSADETITGEVNSFLSRELRTLPNVRIEADRPDYVLRVMALEQKTLGGQKAGFAMSVLASEPLDTSTFSLLVASCAESDTLQASMLRTFAIGAERILNHWLRTGPSDDLRDCCVRIVADFDTQYLEPTRKFREKVLESLNKRNR